jgi:hypothetical protein
MSAVRSSVSALQLVNVPSPEAPVSAFKSIFTACLAGTILQPDKVLQRIEAGKYICRLFKAGDESQAIVSYDKKPFCYRTIEQAVRVHIAYSAGNSDLQRDLLKYVAEQIDSIGGKALIFHVSNQNAVLLRALRQLKIKEESYRESPLFTCLDVSDFLKQIGKSNMEKNAPTSSSSDKARTTASQSVSSSSSSVQKDSHVAKNVRVIKPQPIPIPVPGRSNPPKLTERALKATGSPHELSFRQFKGVTLMKKYIHYIQSGEKTVEGRINSGMFKNIHERDLLRFFLYGKPSR